MNINFEKKEKQLNTLLTKCLKERFLNECVLISCIIMSVVLLYTHLNENIEQRQRERLSGSHSYIVFDYTDAVKEYCIRDAYTNEYGVMSVSGRILTEKNTGGEASTAGYIGTVDEGFLDFESINLIDGHFPENDNEVTLEASILDSLNIPYEIGTTIQLDIEDTNGQVSREEFVLCGITENWTVNWKNEGHPLAGALIKNSNGSMEKSLFVVAYHAEERSLNSIKKYAENEKCDFVYNEYSYPRRDEHFSGMILENMPCIIGCLCVLFIYSAIHIYSFSRREANLKMLRELGADPVILRRVLLYNSGQRVLQYNFISLICFSLAFVAIDASGQVTAIVGENGSGKSMLFRTIAGLITPNEGKLFYNGEEIRKNAFPVIGIMIDRASLFPEFNGYENLKYLAGIRKIADEKTIKKCIKRVGLDPDDRRLFQEYSLGMKQRLLLAQALLDDPDIIILDEVTNGIDDNGKKLVYEIIREEAEKNKIVIISSHVHADIQEVSDIVYRMDNGQCFHENEVI